MEWGRGKWEGGKGGGGRERAGEVEVEVFFVSDALCFSLFLISGQSRSRCLSPARDFFHCIPVPVTINYSRSG